MSETLFNLLNLAHGTVPTDSVLSPLIFNVMPSLPDSKEHFHWFKVFENFLSSIPTLCLSIVTVMVTWRIAKENRHIAEEQKKISDENKNISKNKLAFDVYNKKIELLINMNNLYKTLMLDFNIGHLTDSKFEENMKLRFALTNEQSTLIANFNLYRSIFSDASYKLLWDTYDSLENICKIKSSLLIKRNIAQEEVNNLLNVTNQMRIFKWTKLWDHLNKEELIVNFL